MKNISLAIILAFSALACAQTTTIYTGTIKGLDNNAVTSGQVTFTLKPGMDTTISGVARFSPSTITCAISGAGAVKAADGVSACTVVNNTALTPMGSYYMICEQPNFVTPGACFNDYALGGTKDISTVVPTPGTAPAFTFVDTYSNQTVAGNKTFTGTTTFSGSFGVGALTASSLGINALGTATSGANFNSGNAVWNASIWNGSIATPDAFTCKNVVGTGANPTAVLTCTHSGSSGTSLASMPDTIYGGGSTAIDIRFFGAKCDGSTNDQGALVSAWNVAKALNGGIVWIPATSGGCVIASQVIEDGSLNVRMTGPGGSQWPATQGITKPLLKYTGADASFLSCKGCVGVEIDHVNITYSNAAFTGRLLDFQKNGAVVAQGIHIHHMALQGTSGVATGATCLLCLDFSDDVFVGPLVSFDWAVNGVKATSVTASTIQGSIFSTAAGTLSGYAIKDLGTNLSVLGNTFELGTGAGTIGIIDCSSSCGSNLYFSGNWAGDAPAGWNGTLFNALGTGGGVAFGFQGNTLSGGSGLSGKLITVTGGTSGLSFTGANNVSNFGTAFQIDAATSDCNISGNSWSSITNFLAGAVGVCNSGTVVDNTGLRKEFSVVDFRNANPFKIAGAAPSGHVPRGNGTSYVDGQISGSDLSTGTQTNQTLDGPSSGNAVDLIDKSYPAAGITGNGALQTAITLTIPGGVMAAGKGVMAHIEWVHSTGTAATAYTLKYGTVALLNAASSANTGLFAVDIYIWNKSGVTNAQWLSRGPTFNGSGAAVVFSPDSNGFGGSIGASSQDSTGSLTITLAFNVAVTDAVAPGMSWIKLLQ